MSQTNIYDANTKAVSAGTYKPKYINICVPATAAESGFMLQKMLEEMVWHGTFNAPHVRQGLRHLAAEALQEFAAGEVEEGGFAIE